MKKILAFVFLFVLMFSLQLIYTDYRLNKKIEKMEFEQMKLNHSVLETAVLTKLAGSELEQYHIDSKPIHSEKGVKLVQTDSNQTDDTMLLASGF